MPHYLNVYGKVSIPAPNAVYISAKILPLIDPGVKGPNHLERQLLYLMSKIETFAILLMTF